MRPVVSSMRSRQTGQVGNSIRFGVGGGKGRSEVLMTGFGSDSSPFETDGVSIVMDLIMVTWQISRYSVLAISPDSQIVTVS
jgi:hypothetical protein